MPNLPKKLQLKLTNRTEKNSFRKLPKESNLIDFSSNDYLGFAREQSFLHDASKLLSEYKYVKNGATGSRLLTGNHPLYNQLELKLSQFFKSDAALVFNSGYDANIGFFSCVPQRGDIVFYDEFIHASIRDGINLGNAKSYKFKHNDLEDLKLKCQSIFQNAKANIQNQPDIYVVTEAIFSMDGDTPDLKGFAEFCAINNLHLVVDEAHSVGVWGKNGEGLICHFGLENNVFARIVTFGKALGCHGAAILGKADLKDYLVNFARSFIYTTALPPHAIASIIVSLNFSNTIRGAFKRQDLMQRRDFFRSELRRMNLIGNFAQCNSAIQSMLVQGNDRARFLARKLNESGFDVKPILSPTVTKGKERLRFCIHAYNSKEEITDCLSILVKFR